MSVFSLTEGMAVNQQYPNGGWHGGAAPPGSEEEVRTIFVLGFPTDVKERELQNLLRWWPGYEACQMNFKGDQPMGFALFETGPMAIAARDALQNLVFDSETNSVLRAELAKKNLYVRRGTVSAGGVETGKRLRTTGDYTPTPYQAHAPYPPQQHGWGASGYAPPVPQPPYDPYGYQMAHAPPPMPPIQPSGYAPVQNTKDNPPCNTLFIGNLGDSISEAELQGLFSGQPGFRQLKLLRGASGITCFVEFQDIPTAMAVHQSMQGAVLTTSDRGGMRIQYSKNPFGRKRDGSRIGAPQATAAPSPVPAAAPQQQAGETGAVEAPQPNKPAEAAPAIVEAQQSNTEQTTAPVVATNGEAETAAKADGE